MPGLSFLLGFSSIGRIIAALIEFASPLFKVVVEFISFYAKQLWEGTKDILDSAATIITVLSLVFAAYLYASSLNKEVFIETKCIDRTTGKRVTQYKDAAYERFQNIFK